MAVGSVSRVATLALCVLAVFASLPCAAAADLRVISAGAVRGVLAGMTDDYSVALA